MKKKFKFLCILCLCLSMTICSFGKINIPVSAATGKTLKVLAIGNSFSEDATRHLYQIAKSLGATDVVIGNMYIGGCNLATHWNNAKNNSAAYKYQKNSTGTWTSKANTTMLYGIQDESWDVITIQQVSGYSGIESTYNSDITNLVSYINSNKTNSNAKIGWHMSWAYQGNSTHANFPLYSNNQMTMYNKIVSATQNKIVTNPSFDFIIPTGTAIQNIRSSSIGDTLTRDGYHLSLNLGRYVAGLTWLKALTGWSIDDITWVPNTSEIPAKYLPIIKEAVNNAVNTPYAVTQSTFITNPTLDYNKYNAFDWEPVGLSYWNSTNQTQHSILITTKNSTASNLKYFVSSGKMFTKEDLPIGSIIEIDAGYQYRPEGWTSLSLQSSRPNAVTTERIVIDDDWWGNYKYRAFNISFVGNNTDITGKIDDTALHFRIYIPKSDEKAILEFKIMGVEGVVSDESIVFSFPAGTDITAVVPYITISEKATISPDFGIPQDFTNPVQYTVTAEDGSKSIYTVTVEIEPLPETTTEDVVSGCKKSSIFITIATFVSAMCIVIFTKRRI